MSNQISVFNWLVGEIHSWGWDKNLSYFTAHLIVVLTLILVCGLLNLFARKYLLHIIGNLVRRTPTKWDDVFFDNHVFDWLSHLAPAVVVYHATFVYGSGYENLVLMIQKAAYIYMLIVGVLVVFSTFDAIQEIYRDYHMAKGRPIKGYLQAVKVVIVVLAGLVVVGILTGRSPLVLISGLGALTAVLILVFRDSILGFVAGIQLAANDMINEGDWIEVPGAGADGEVEEVSLTVVKVRNWDQTITAVPIYHLVSKSFTNWKGMFESGGRRLKRSLHVDVRSVKFADRGLLNTLRELNLLPQVYLEQSPTEMPSNLTLFREYMNQLLDQHEQINSNMVHMVRQLQPGPHGVPLEMYAFIKDQRWVYYETIMAEIVEELLATVHAFELRIYQHPSTHDLAGFRLEPDHS